MFGAILKATNSSFQKGMTFCRSIYVKKVMKLLAFIFEQPSYMSSRELKTSKCSLVLHTHENSDVFNTLDEIYLVFISKK